MFFPIVLLSTLLITTGCSNNEIYEELTKETFSELDLSEVISVSIVSVYPDDGVVWRIIYWDVSPIKDTEKIETIFRCINEAESIVHSTSRRKMFFRTKSTIYYIGIGLGDEKVYGDWWDSSELKEYLKKWDLERPKKKYPPFEPVTDSNYVPQGMLGDTPKEDPNTVTVFVPFGESTTVPITLKKDGSGGYIGPDGKKYTTMPTMEQLAEDYPL